MKRARHTSAQEAPADVRRSLATRQRRAPALAERLAVPWVRWALRSHRLAATLFCPDLASWWRVRWLPRSRALVQVRLQADCWVRWSEQEFPKNASSSMRPVSRKAEF